MKMNLSFVMGLLLAGAAITLYAADEPKDTPAVEKPAVAPQVVYVCQHCDTMALKAGKCGKCEKEMAQRHLLGTKDGQAMLCPCGGDCKCDAKGIKDGKCGCDKDVKMMSCKGMYCCTSGCPMVSKTPGKCACGIEMKKAE